MKIADLILEQQPVGTIGTTAGFTQPVGQTPTVSQNPAVTGNTQALADPKLQAATLAKQKQDKDAQKKQVADQIKTLQQQLQTLQRQQQDLNRL